MTTKLRWTMSAGSLLVLLALMPSPVAACAVCMDLPIYLPGGGGFTDNDVCLYAFPAGAMDCIQVSSGDGRQGCILLGNWCNEMEITDPGEPAAIALAGAGQGCQPWVMTAPSQPIQVTTVR